MVVLGWRLDLVILEVFSNLNDPMILWEYYGVSILLLILVMIVWINWLPVNYIINKSIKHFDSSFWLSYVHSVFLCDGRREKRSEERM